MKINRITGHFGNIRGRVFNFTDGLNILVMENESGKTTLCALIRVMLYGLRTNRRDTRNALSDKTHYSPQDNYPMEGIMDIEVGGRTIVLSRTTGSGGLMQEFDAYDKNNGRKCTFLTAKETGNTLFGVGEDGFLASCMIDGTDLSLSSKELQDKMISMSSTGDVRALYTRIAEKLKRYQLDINSGNGSGEEPRLLVALSENEKKKEKAEIILGKLEELEKEIQNIKEKESALVREKQITVEELSQDIYAKEDRLLALEKEVLKKVKEIRGQIPDPEVMKEADDAMFAYEGAVRLDRQRRERLATADQEYQKQHEKLEEERLEEDDRLYRESTPKIRWWALMSAAVFGSAGFGLYLMQPTLFYVPLVFFVITAIFLLIAVVGRNPEPKGDHRPFYEKEMRRLEKERREIDTDQKQGADILQESYDRIMKVGKQLKPSVEDIAGVIQTIQNCRTARTRLEHEKKLLDEVREELEDSRTGKGETLHQKLDGLEEEIQDTQQMVSELQKKAARLEGTITVIGDEKILAEEKAQLEDQLEDIQLNKKALSYVKQLLQEENERLTAEISPEITAYARNYLQEMTDGKYTDVRMTEDFNGACGEKDGIMLDPLRLSSGTRDQLYLALRLAVCKVLLRSGEPAPLILDDPFITFDEGRQKRALTLLKRIAEERQVILLASKKFEK